MKEIAFANKGGVMWANHVDDCIEIDDVIGWLERLITQSLTHEVIHFVLDDIEDSDTTKQFDNLFGLFDPSIILVPQDNTVYREIMEERLNRIGVKDYSGLFK